MQQTANKRAWGARSGLWGLIAGAAGALCCIGPSLALLLGLGSSSALVGLSFNRGEALVWGLLLLAPGLLYLRHRARSCGLQPWRGTTMLLATFGVSYALLAYALPWAAARSAPEPPPLPTHASAAAPVTLRRLTVSIDKMDCPPCVVSVRRILGEQVAVHAFIAQEGLDEVRIDYNPTLMSGEQVFALFPASYHATYLSDSELP